MFSSGVYEIINEKSGHKYVGSSVNIQRRWINHKTQLRGNYHHNNHLQNAWNKYGEDNFKFRVLVYTEPVDCIRIENLLLSTNDYDYNIALNATKPLLGREFSKKHRMKISRANSGENHWLWGKHHSKETKERLREASKSKKHSVSTKESLSSMRLGKKNPMYGKHHSEEAKQKISFSQKDREFSEEHREKLSKNSWMLGRRGDKCPRYISISLEDKKEILSLRERGMSYRELGELFGISQSTIRSRILEWSS